MADSYEIIDGQVVPYYGGRKGRDTDAWRDATPLEIQMQSQLVDAESAIDALRAEVKLARDGWHMANGVADLAMKHRDAAESRAERAEVEAESMRADAERYRWLRQDAGFDGWTMPKPPAPCPDSIAGCKVQHHGREVSGAALDAAIDAARKGAE